MVSTIVLGDGGCATLDRWQALSNCLLSIVPGRPTIPQSPAPFRLSYKKAERGGQWDSGRWPETMDLPVSLFLTTCLGLCFLLWAYLLL